MLGAGVVHFFVGLQSGSNRLMLAAASPDVAPT
jgi:hypothetical protein